MSSTSLYRPSCRQAFRRYLAIAAFSFFWTIGHVDVAGSESRSLAEPFSALKARLIQEGFDEPLIQSLYSSPEVVFDQQGISVYFSHREAALDYDQFLSKSSIEKAINYLSRHQEALKEARRVYGVDEEIITAIILVETRLGTFIGKRMVLNTLSTLAALGDKDTRDAFWQAHLRNKASVSQQQFDSWASRKSAWAYAELKAYLQYTEAQGFDPLSMRGSFAGALGIPQFVPSSILRFGKDGNRDGRVNLFDHEDAIESIASYLNQHGWHPSLTREEALQVLLSYNNSRYYANTILDAAKRMAKLRP